MQHRYTLMLECFQHGRGGIATFLSPPGPPAPFAEITGLGKSHPGIQNHHFVMVNLKKLAGLELFSI